MLTPKIQFVRAHTLTLDQVTEAYNRGFEDVPAELSMTTQERRAANKRDSIELSASWVTFLDNEPAGVVLMGIRGQYGWLGALSLSPELRVYGVGEQLMLAFIESGREHQLDQLALEVVGENHAAIGLYETLGFRRLRVLNGWSCDPPLRQDGWISLRRTVISEVIEYMADFHDDPLPWQFSAETLRQDPQDYEALVYQENSETLGYIIYALRYNIIRLYSFGAVNEAISRVLLAHVHSLRPDLPVYVACIPAGSPMDDALAMMGYHEEVAEYEMILKL